MKDQKNFLPKDKVIKGVPDIPYDILVSQNQAGIFYLDHDIILFGNQAFAQILSSTPEKIIGASILDFVKEKDRNILSEGLTKLNNKELTEFSAEIELNSNEEEEKATFFSTHLTTHQIEGRTRIIGASRNATSRIKKFKQLSDTTSLFEALYKNIVDGIIIYDYNQEKIIDCNPSALKIFGYEQKENLLKVNRFGFVPEFSSTFPGINFHKETSHHGDQVRNGQAFKTPGAFIKKNGDHIIVHANVVPTFRNHGEAFIIFQDSTKRVMANKVQKETEKRYRQIFENSHEAIIYYQLNIEKPIICNDNALKLLGIDSLEELSNYSPSDFIIPDEGDTESAVTGYQRVLKETAKNGRHKLSFWLKKKTGEVIRVSSVYIYDNSDPKNPKAIAFFRDITNLHHTRVTLNEKNLELEKYIESNLQLENFAYFASHDLQTPLRSINSFTQLLQLSLKNKISAKEEKYMNQILSSSRNMQNLVNDLLSYSRVNTSDLNIEAFDPKQLIDSLWMEYESISLEQNIQFKVEKLPKIILGDRSKIRQVLQNLISNAVKFCPKDKAPSISIGTNEDEEYWSFYVKDNGIGMEEIYLEKIFLLFKRLHTHRDFEGTGIGLALVKKIIEQHGGNIWVESKPGEGSTFYFRLKKEV